MHSKETRQLGDEDKELYTNYIPIITIISSTSEFLIFPDAKMTGVSSLATPRQSAAKPNWKNRVPHFGLGPKPKWEGPKPK